MAIPGADPSPNAEPGAPAKELGPSPPLSEGPLDHVRGLPYRGPLSVAPSQALGPTVCVCVCGGAGVGGGGWRQAVQGSGEQGDLWMRCQTDLGLARCDPGP